MFSWDDVDRLGDLERLRLALEALPDEALLTALEKRRGRGRDDYPVRAMWRAVVAMIVPAASLARGAGAGAAAQPGAARSVRVGSIRSAGRGGRGCRRETGPDGRANVVVFEPARFRDGVPSAYNFTRFLATVAELEAEEGLMAAMLAPLRGDLMALLPDFGRHLGYDGKALPAYATGRDTPSTGEPADPDADWGRHETAGKPDKVWFGYGMHVIADTMYEIPVAYRLTKASTSEVKTLEAMAADLFRDEPTLAERCRDFSADRGLDSGPLKARLWDTWAIRPLIPARRLWQAEKRDAATMPKGTAAADEPTRALDPRRADTVVHTEKGEVRCICPASGTERAMVFQGFEADRATLKYRCPAAAERSVCEGRERCHRLAGCRPGPYGRIVRVPLAHDRRIFTPTPYGSPSWHRGVPAPLRPRADLQPHRPRLRLRAALRARPGAPAGAHHARRRRHDGDGPRPRPGRPGPDRCARWSAPSPIPGSRRLYVLLPVRSDRPPPAGAATLAPRPGNRRHHAPARPVPA